MKDLPTVDELRRLMPSSWIPVQDIVKPTRRRHWENHDCVMICRTYLSVPNRTWAELGDPAMVAAGFEGYDLLLTPGREASASRTKYVVRLNFDKRTPRFRDYVVMGRYESDKFRVELRNGLAVLRITGAAFQHVDAKMRDTWQDQHQFRRR